MILRISIILKLQNDQKNLIAILYYTYYSPVAFFLGSAIVDELDDVTLPLLIFLTSDD